MKRKALTLITLLLTPYIQSNIDITTLSDWDINDFDEHTLLVAKSSDTSTAWKSILAFSVSRPNCVSTQPIIMVRSKSSNNWFKLLKFPSFESSDRVEIKFKSQTPLKSFAVNTTGIRKASYVAEQVCNSPVTIQQTVSRLEKI